MSKNFEENKNLESFFRNQERLLKENEKYSRFLFAPIIVIVVSILILSYNVTAGRKLNFGQNPFADKVSWADMDNVQQTVDVGNGEKSTDGKINLNTATLDDMKGFRGIGEAKAAAIVELREDMGGFKSVEDILNVSGIGDKILDEIKDKVYVETRQ